jgi:hypothetical protein
VQQPEAVGLDGEGIALSLDLELAFQGTMECSGHAGLLSIGHPRSAS